MTFELLYNSVQDANIDWENPFDEIRCLEWKLEPMWSSPIRYNYIVYNWFMV